MLMWRENGLGVLVVLTRPIKLPQPVQNVSFMPSNRSALCCLSLAYVLIRSFVLIPSNRLLL